MGAEPLPPAEGLLLRVVPNGAAAAAIRAELNRPPRPPEEVRALSVSKLVNPGRAYYDVVCPVDEGIAAHEDRLAGSGAHEALEAALAARPELTELWLSGEDAPGSPSLEGIVARIDAAEPLGDGRLSPTELKTVRSDRGGPYDDHLEQLGMYCALTGSESGHLIRVLREGPPAPESPMMPLKVTYPDLAPIREEMVRRRDLLREALRTRDPSHLPACPWWSAGCEHRRAGHCNCGERPRLEPVIARQARVVEDPEFQATLVARVRDWSLTRRVTSRPPTLRQLPMLRKIYFERRAPAAPADEAPGTDGAAPTAAGELSQATHAGLGREITRLVKRAHKATLTWARPSVPGALWEIPLVEGRPFLVKVRSVRRAVAPTVSDLTGTWGAPEEVRLLAAEVALAGASEGRLYLWNSKIADEATKLQVFDLAFDPAGADRAGAAARALPGALEAALAAEDPRRLPLCPTWMCPKCEYRETCRPDLG